MITQIVDNTILSLQDYQNNKVKGFTIKYTNNRIAGQFSFRANQNRRHHCIMISSRFNTQSREENPPFPGWFIQLVGERLSMGIGNGKTWLSVKCPNNIKKNETNQVHFSLNNVTKKVVLGLNHQFTTKSNIVFRRPVSFLTIGALNMKGEFRFEGELNNIMIGSSLVEVQLNQDVDAKLNQNIETFVTQSHQLIDTIRNNMHNIDNDIQSLQDIKNKIVSWTLRGLQLDSALLDAQIDTFTQNKTKFLDTFVNDIKDLDILNHKINRDEKTFNNNQNVFQYYKDIMSFLLKDVVTLDTVVHELSQFKELGIELGTAFESIKKQREMICTKIKDTMKQLETYESQTREMMNLITINES